MTFSVSSYAQELGPPIYASKQKQVTSDSMKYEADQFRSRAQYDNSRNQLNSNLVRRDLLKNELDRAQTLLEKGQITETKFQQYRQNYQNSEDAVSRSEVEVQKSKAAAEVAGLRVIESGNPESDHRLEINQAMTNSLINEKKGLDKNLVNANDNRSYFQTRYDNGKYLFERQVISLQEFERRQLDLRSAEDNLNSIKFQISGIEESILGLKAARRKLLDQ